MTDKYTHEQIKAYTSGLSSGGKWKAFGGARIYDESERIILFELKPEMYRQTSIDHDADFIAASPQIIRQLLQEISELEAKAAYCSITCHSRTVNRIGNSWYSHNKSGVPKREPDLLSALKSIAP